MHLWEISILSLNNVIVRPTKIMNRAVRNWAHFKKTNFKNQKLQKISFIKIDLLVKYYSQKKNSERLGWFLKPPNDFEEVVHNFGRSGDDMI